MRSRLCALVSSLAIIAIVRTWRDLMDTDRWDWDWSEKT